ncbi:unnamed protein product [Heligmosomoides polygyrus]|uniref:G_PROTEIN_RECEP_F1_2 domain-containing protein n=1 Tax=Heligmosomoides polygyrus TaxID=6339 RepID=A0A3P7Y2H7_HELPZ|nr:unnamed protein product [Heligmosomoides polygyrus]
MTECPDAAAYISFIPQHISSSVHIAICIISIVVNLMFIRVCQRDLPCHQNFRVLILALIFVNFMHSLTYIVILMTHLVKVATSKEPCDVLVSGLFCYVTRLITSSCYTAHTTLLFGLLSERVIATKITRDVNSKYQASENLRVLRLLGPLLILHFVGYPFYFAISVVVQSLMAIFGELTFRVIYSVVYQSVLMIEGLMLFWEDEDVVILTPCIMDESKKIDKEKDLACYILKYGQTDCC